MSRDHTTQFVDAEMRDGDIDGLLRTQGYGIVSLCEEGEPYSIPVSFGYDGEVLYIPFLVTDGEATKTSFIGPGEQVRVVVASITDRYEWQSVAVTGEAEPVAQSSEEWEHFLDTLVANGWFERGFETTVSIEGWRLDAGDAQGVERRRIHYE